MQRFLVLIMLCLLPLQTSWAMVADYCVHEQDKATQHFGHHDDEHKASPGALADNTESGSDNPVQGGSDSNPNSSHDHSHLSSFLGVLSVYTLSMCAPLQISLHCDDQSYSFLAADKPARPNWFVTA